MAFVSTIAVGLAVRLLVEPLCGLRHARAAVDLETGLHAAAPTSALTHRWSAP